MKKAIQLIDQDLTKFEDYFSKAVKSNAPLLDRIMQYIVKRKGKQMRPMFVLLSAKLGGEITTATYRAASLVELLPQSPIAKKRSLRVVLSGGNVKK